MSKLVPSLTYFSDHFEETIVASEFIAISILASVVKKYRGYIMYIGGCVSIFKHPVSDRTQNDKNIAQVV